MKIVPKILTVAITVSLTLPKPTNAVPIVVAPLICAKVCVLIGTTIVGGVTSYIWHNRINNKKYFADRSGNVRKMLADPEEEIGVWEDPLDTRNYKKAKEICKARAKKIGASVDLRQDEVTGRWICVFTGGSEGW